MIWRCVTCGNVVSRHDEPRVGLQTFYCTGCMRSSMFRSTGDVGLPKQSPGRYGQGPLRPPPPSQQTTKGDRP